MYVFMPPKITADRGGGQARDPCAPELCALQLEPLEESSQV
jgi:hypothetical protein